MENKEDILARIRNLEYSNQQQNNQSQNNQIDTEPVGPIHLHVGGVPVIRTTEDGLDPYNQTQNIPQNVSREDMIATGQYADQYNIQPDYASQPHYIATDDLESKKAEEKRKLIIWASSIGIIFIIGALTALFYFKYYKQQTTYNATNNNINNNLNNSNQTNTTITTVPVTLNTSNINNVWPSAASSLGAYTGDATSTEKHIIIDIKDFNFVYQYLLQNESLFNEISNRFGYNTLQPFHDTTINDIDMRVADGGVGAVVYGYVNQNKLLIANSLNEWLEMRDALQNK